MFFGRFLCFKSTIFESGIFLSGVFCFNVWCPLRGESAPPLRRVVLFAGGFFLFSLRPQHFSFFSLESFWVCLGPVGEPPPYYIVPVILARFLSPLPRVHH